MSSKSSSSSSRSVAAASSAASTTTTSTVGVAAAATATTVVGPIVIATVLGLTYSFTTKDQRTDLLKWVNSFVSVYSGNGPATMMTGHHDPSKVLKLKDQQQNHKQRTIRPKSSIWRTTVRKVGRKVNAVIARHYTVTPVATSSNSVSLMCGDMDVFLVDDQQPHPTLTKDFEFESESFQEDQQQQQHQKETEEEDDEEESQAKVPPSSSTSVNETDLNTTTTTKVVETSFVTELSSSTSVTSFTSSSSYTSSQDELDGMVGLDIDSDDCAVTTTDIKTQSKGIDVAVDDDEVVGTIIILLFLSMVVMAVVAAPHYDTSTILRLWSEQLSSVRSTITTFMQQYASSAVSKDLVQQQFHIIHHHATQSYDMVSSYVADAANTLTDMTNNVVVAVTAST